MNIPVSRRRRSTAPDRARSVRADRGGRPRDVAVGQGRPVAGASGLSAAGPGLWLSDARRRGADLSEVRRVRRLATHARLMPAIRACDLHNISVTARGAATSSILLSEPVL